MGLREMLVIVVQQLAVDSGHCHEYGNLWGFRTQEFFPNLLSTELRQHDTGGSYPEWTEQLVDHAVDMVQREDVKDHIVFSPRP